MLAHRLLGIRGHSVDYAGLRARVRDRCVVVTGASRGVGRQVALQLARAGARPVLVARGSDALAEVAAEIERLGAVVSTVALDLRDLEAASAAARAISAQHGPPALLVSNAGHSIRRNLADYTDRLHDVTRLVGVNMTGPIAFAMPLLEAMRGAHDGHLVSVGSVAMTMPGPGWSAYTASKAGFDAWLRSVAPELRASGVAVTSVHLPLTRTAMSAPTYSGSRVPALTAAEAATWVGRAVIARPRVVAPWWGRLGAVLTAAAPALADRTAGAIWRSVR